MQIVDFHCTDCPPLPPTVVSVGNFDGLHAGHMQLLNELKKQAELLGRKSCVVTFDPHTRAITHPDSAPPILTSVAEKALLLERAGIDYLAILPFDTTMAAMTSERFVDEVLIGRLNANEWVMGEDHRFGSERRGSSDFLHRERDRNHITVLTVPLHGISEGEAASSTRIRNLVSKGQMKEALFLLGHPYIVMAERTRGEKIGSRNGFPTLNFSRPPSEKLIPPPGIYAAEVTFDNVTLQGAMYLGQCPTYGVRDLHFEFHAFTPPLCEPSYGSTACLWIHQFIRPDQVFANEALLVKQIRTDVSEIQTFFSARSTE